VRIAARRDRRRPASLTNLPTAVVRSGTREDAYPASGLMFHYAARQCARSGTFSRCRLSANPEDVDTVHLLRSGLASPGSISLYIAPNDLRLDSGRACGYLSGESLIESG
jgi:hypothetical protein